MSGFLSALAVHLGAPSSLFSQGQKYRSYSCTTKPEWCDIPGYVLFVCKHAATSLLDLQQARLE